MEYYTELEGRLLKYKEVKTLTITLHLIIIFASLILFLQFNLDPCFLISVIFIANLVMRLKENRSNFYCSIANFIISERLDRTCYLESSEVFSRRQIKVINTYLGKLGAVEIVSKI